MKVYTLMEESKRRNTGFIAEHGLSLYFEKDGKRILFDTGASDSFIYNATLLGIDLSKVDACVVSHAYNDHTGGLKDFLELNRKAKVYMKKDAAGDFLIKKMYKMSRVGIDPKLFEEHPGRFEFIESDIEIAPGIFAVNIDKHRHYPRFTSLMYKTAENKLERDGLSHELFAAVKEPEGAVVMTGCSHQGVLNILLTAEQKFGRIKGVIGGFHLDGRERFGMMRKKEPAAEVNAIIRHINNNNIKKVYTGHGVGESQMERLELMARVKRLYSGDIVEI